MIELIVLNDPPPGRRFQLGAAPIRLGRRRGLEVVLIDPGVWDDHAEISATPEGWFRVRAAGQAHLSVNDHPVTEHRLRTGDVLGIGSVKVQFELRRPLQVSLGLRETAVWILIAAVVVAAIVVMLAIGN